MQRVKKGAQIALCHPDGCDLFCQDMVVVYSRSHSKLVTYYCSPPPPPFLPSSLQLQLPYMAMQNLGPLELYDSYNRGEENTRIILERGDYWAGSMLVWSRMPLLHKARMRINSTLSAQKREIGC